MKIKNCPECGAEIVFHYETPTKAYRIENETLVRDDNIIDDNPMLTPYCSNDKEHKIEPDKLDELKEFWLWVDSIYMYFIDMGIYQL